MWRRSCTTSSCIPLRKKRLILRPGNLSAFPRHWNLRVQIGCLSSKHTYLPFVSFVCKPETDLLSHVIAASVRRVKATVLFRFRMNKGLSCYCKKGVNYTFTVTATNHFMCFAKASIKLNSQPSHEVCSHKYWHFFFPCFLCCLSDWHLVQTSSFSLSSNAKGMTENKDKLVLYKEIKVLYFPFWKVHLKGNTKGRLHSQPRFEKCQKRGGWFGSMIDNEASLR